MASASLVPKNGAVSIGSLVADFASFDVTASQNVEPVTPYGANVNTKSVGSGTTGFAFNVGAFALAHAANTPLLMPTLSATGAACVFTLDTGVTESATCVTSMIRLTHARMRAAVPISLSLVNYGDCTEAWVAS